MGRLFDSSRNRVDAERARATRKEIADRAAEADAMLAEYQELDEQSKKIRAQLSTAQRVQPIVYQEYRRPGSKWMIEHAQVGDDYVYQLFTLRPTVLSVPDILQLMIIAMDVIFPRSVRIDYVPPSALYKAEMYTIKVRSVVGLPGWEEACQVKALRGLSGVEAWKASG